MNAFPYPGNKARHADWIIDHIPKHECYVELFGGAAGVLFNKPRSKIEVYNDINGDIPHFFRVLRERCGELQDWLENVPYSREVYDKWASEYYSGHRPNDDIERAGRFFSLRYMQFGGKIENKSGFAYRVDGNSTASQFTSKIDILHKFRDRLRDVEIESVDAFNLIDRRDSPQTVFYADPPYENTEGRYNSQGFDHKKLASKAKTVDGQIIISYDSIPSFYDDSFSVASKDSNFAIDGNGVRKDVTEYLIMNYNPDGTPLMAEENQSDLDSYC